MKLHITGYSLAKSKGPGSTYYTFESALEFKVWADRWIKIKPDDIVIRESPDVSIDTLAQKFFLGKKYLLDHIDPNGYYAKELVNLKIKKTTKNKLRSVRFTTSVFRKMANNSDISYTVEERFKPKKDILVDSLWRQQLADFLEKTDPPAKFERIGLSLTQQEIEDFESMFAVMDDIVYVITETSIAVVKK